MNKLQDLLSHSDIIAVDTETNVTESLAGRFCVGISIATETETFYIPLGHRGELFSDNYVGVLPKDMFERVLKVIFHNAKFDLHVLEKLGFHFNPASIEDTMMMSHYIDEYPPHGLKELAESVLNWKSAKTDKDWIKVFSKDGGGYETVPIPAMARYAEQDVRMTFDLYKALWNKFEPYRGLWESVDRDFMFLLKEMESRGILVDLEGAAEQSAAASKRMQQIASELGFDPQKSTVLAKKLFDSPPYGLGLKASTFGISGRPKMDEAFLSSIGHPVTALVLEYRGLLKAKSSYFDAYTRHAGQTARIHPNFKQHGTLTGRLSCENPNLQQIPRDSPIKKLFLPEPDCELWEFDFRGIEYRLSAVYSEEPDLMDGFRNEFDFHQAVADKLGISRHAAKTVNFLIIYGGGAKKLSAGLRIPYASALTIINDFKDSYPGLTRRMREATEVAEYQGYISMWTGRQRHIKYPSEAYKAFNSVIQGGAFEIVKRSMLKLHEAGYDIRNQVHDSVWVNIPKEEVQNARREIPRLLSDWTEERFDLRFSVDEKRLN
jgi:DNA polymerase-1